MQKASRSLNRAGDNVIKNLFIAILKFDIWLFVNIEYYVSRAFYFCKPILEILLLMSIGAGLLIICGGLLMTNNESFDDNDHHESTYSHDEYLAVPDDSVFYMPLLQKEMLRLKEKLHHLELTVKRMNSQLQAYCNNKKSVEVLPDFASETVGGSIVGIPDTESFHEPNVRISLFGIPIPLWNPNYRSPRTILQPWTEAGECWPFRGSQGNVIIELAQLAIVDHVTLEHIPASASLTGSITSAPKEFRVLVGLCK